MINLSIALAFFVLITLGLLWYVRHMLKKLLFVSDNLSELLEIVEEFGDHLASVHELETFYGEPVLQDLMRHSKYVQEYMSKYRDIYELSDVEYDEEDLLQEEEEVGFE